MEQEVQAPAPEGTPPPTPAPEPGEIARSMQSVLDRQQSLAKREEQKASIDGMQAEYNQLLWLADNQPVEFLKRRGHTLDQLQENNDGQSNVVDSMVAKIEALSNRLELQDADRVRAQEQANEAATSSKMETWLTGEATNFPLTAAAGGSTLVINEMRKSYDNGGRIISEAEAAQVVEKDLTAFLEQVAPAAGYVKQSNDLANSDAPQTIHSGLSEGSVPQNLDELTGRAKLDALLRKHNI